MINDLYKVVKDFYTLLLEIQSGAQQALWSATIETEAQQRRRHVHADEDNTHAFGGRPERGATQAPLRAPGQDTARAVRVGACDLRTAARAVAVDPARALYAHRARVRDEPSSQSQPRCDLRAAGSRTRAMDQQVRVKMALITKAAIRTKAKKIRSAILQDPRPPSNLALSQLSFSNGQLQKLQRRHGLELQRLHGEAASASVVAIENERAFLQRITSSFEKKDIFNMDESAFFIAWFRQSLPRKAASPGNFNDAMRSENRRVFLLLDNALSHRVDKPLPNVQVYMLPPNTTANLQPQDAGIIRSFKAHMNELKNRYYVDKLDDLFDSSQDEKENFDSSASALFMSTFLWPYNGRNKHGRE